MKNSPEISVIIPAYNCECYVQECLDSLEMQSFKDFELIIIDDGSKDKTLAIIKDYAKKSSLAITLVEQENGGASKARNAGISLAKGKYIAFIDADDTVWPDYFEMLYSEAEKHSADIVTCGYEKYNSETGEIIYSRKPTDWVVNFSEGIRHVFQYSPWAKLIRTDFILANDIRFGEGEIMEDCPFGIVTNSLAKKDVVIPYLGYRYRVHTGSVQDGVRKAGLTANDKGRKFPFNGLSQATKKVLDTRGEEYRQALEYCVGKALAGFVFSFSKNSSKENLRYTCDCCSKLVVEYFPEFVSNPYIRLNAFPQLPLSHRGALVVFKWAYSKRLIYPIARICQFILGFGNHLK